MTGTMNDKRGTMNVNVRARAFIVHRSSLIVTSKKAVLA
jgi:hypothetical protein